jgi:hypothetical protein
MLVIKYALFGIVAMENQPAQTIVSPIYDTTTSNVSRSGPICNLGWPPARHRATISSLALSACASPGVSDQLYFVWESSKRKSTGSDHLLTYLRHYDHECALIRFNCGLSQEPHWATTSYLALSTCASTDASDQIYYVKERNKRKSTGSDHPLTY